MNFERLLVTSPEGINEVLVRNSYDYVKPIFARKLLARVLGGVGMLLAEGEEHRVRHSNCKMFSFGQTYHISKLSASSFGKRYADIRDTLATTEDAHASVRLSLHKEPLSAILVQVL